MLALCLPFEVSGGQGGNINKCYKEGSYLSDCSASCIPAEAEDAGGLYIKCTCVHALMCIYLELGSAGVLLSCYLLCKQQFVWLSFQTSSNYIIIIIITNNNNEEL